MSIPIGCGTAVYLNLSRKKLNGNGCLSGSTSSITNITATVTRYIPKNCHIFAVHADAERGNAPRSDTCVFPQDCLPVYQKSVRRKCPNKLEHTYMTLMSAM